MELVAIYLGFLAFSFVGAHEVAVFLGEPSAYIVAGTALAGHITGAIAGIAYEKKWGQVTGIAGLILSLIMIVAGASALIEQAWPLIAAAGVLASAGVAWLAYLSNNKREAQGRPSISSKTMGFLIGVPFLAVIALSVAVGIATGWY
ncbi:hypothetical protein [Arthrobacter sp. zg-Y1110]|uniref:hypothetical protein n=1 Tax=Arthrobacter sp. zg-Y1110 TaxID=2886932 RepID=UPI001D1407AE|nr:hypothetical protein [Arthrobacter sp. zg-Y1110]MCC3292888.1 hypothetical protein [Arthrobacter sp. zg-Y1110]UWX86826.1 hypothetical protein N2K99_18460 [Arthrobacter sp. zg-Y1110]